MIAGSLSINISLQKIHFFINAYKSVWAFNTDIGVNADVADLDSKLGACL